MTVWSLGTLLYVLLLGDIPYETTDHIIHNKPKKVFFILIGKSWKQNPTKFRFWERHWKQNSLH